MDSETSQSGFPGPWAKWRGRSCGPVLVGTLVELKLANGLHVVRLQGHVASSPDWRITGGPGDIDEYRVLRLPPRTWVQWSGGPQPVPNDSMVALQFKGAAAIVTELPQSRDWGHGNSAFDIICYALIDDGAKALLESPASGPVSSALLPTVDAKPIASSDGPKDTNPKDAAAVGRVPLFMVPGTLELYAAIGFAEGDSKYIAYNFRMAGIRASVYISAAKRHFLRYINGEWADKKTKVPHLASVAACVAILIDGHVTGLIVDDRPPAVDLTEEFARAEEIIVHVYEMNKDKRPTGVSYTIADRCLEPA